MACCGPNIKRVDENELFEKLRNNDEKISLKLNELRLNFNPGEGNWKSN